MAEQTQLLSSWIRHFPGVTQDVSAFYAKVQAAIEKRKLPEVKFERFTLKEGGMFSNSREYLRVRRGDLRYEICGAPFGDGFFVSSRMFADGKFADRMLSDLGAGGALSQIAGGLTAKLIGSDTYYKLDTAQMYLQLVHHALLETVDDLTNSAGTPRLPEAERKPVLQGFFQ